MTTQDIQKEIITEFGYFESWSEKYEYIIELGKKLAPLNDIHKTEDNKIKGCQSNVWLISEFNDGIVKFYADSDSVIVKGLISMLIRVLSGHSPEEILHTELRFIDEIGMTQHLAQTRSNGLLAMVKQMKFYALAYQAKANK